MLSTWEVYNKHYIMDLYWEKCIESLISNKELKRNVKNNFDKDFCKLMNNAVLRKTMKNIKHHRDTKFVTTKARRELFSIRTKLS